MKETLKTIGKAWIAMWVLYGISDVAKNNVKNLRSERRGEGKTEFEWVPVTTYRNFKELAEMFKEDFIK